MKTLFYRLLAVIFSLFLIFTLLITSFEAVCYWNPGYYEAEFEKYDVLDSLQEWRGETMTMDDLTAVMHQTMVYLRGDRENLIVETEINGREAEFYNENEKSHMADVRVLFVASVTLRALAILAILAIFGLLLILEHGRALYWLGRGFLRVCLAIGILAALFGLLAATDFTKYFTLFHELFFSQGNWMFDPRESRMINMLPEGFFSDTALRILLTFLGAIAVLLIPAGIFTKFAKNWGYQ